MIKSKVVRVPIYGAKYTLILWDNDQELQERFKTYEFDPDICEFDGGIFRIGDQDYLALKVYKNKGYLYPTPGIIAHECKHAVNRIFTDVGQRLDAYNDEAECYLLGWFVNLVHEFADKYKKEFKV